jgi:hypothetical protein
MLEVPSGLFKSCQSVTQANIDSLILGDDRGKTQRFVKDGCASYWFSSFAIGCKHWMGQDWRPNQAFSTELLLAYLCGLEFRIADATSWSKLNRWLVVGAYLVVTYVISLRGSEGFLFDLGKDDIASTYHAFGRLGDRRAQENCTRESEEMILT